MSESVEPNSSIKPDMVEREANNSSLTDLLIYGLSLPERTIRSASAIVSGVVHESAAHLIPVAFRTSRSYQVFIQQSLDLLRHDVGGVTKQNVAATAQETELAKRAVGGLLDFAGVATLHMSPLAILAIFQDVAYGSNQMLQKLADELRREGIIDDQSSIHHISDLIQSLERASATAADALEKPPLNIDGFRAAVTQISERVQDIDPAQLLPKQELSRMWEDMEQEAKTSNASLWDISTAMTLFAMNRLALTSKGALSTMIVAGNLLDEHILQHYQSSLTAIRRDGLYATLSTASDPYLDALWHNFDRQRETWTGDLLTGKLFRRAVDRVRGWF
jgi:hypothetical protein